MNYWVGVTDNRWYRYLSQHGMDEVNFWHPSAHPPFVNRPIGMPFLFKLKNPHNHVAGGGFFVTYSRLPLKLAWEVFGSKNGCGTFSEFEAILASIKGGTPPDEIGCTALDNCFYFPKSEWIERPVGWSPNIVSGKTYDTRTPEGLQLWSQVSQAMDSASQVHAPLVDAYGEPLLVQPRLGQASFRVLVTEAYRRKCAITGETTLAALEAAHIVPFAVEQKHEIKNGLLLRADFHRLYDVGLIGVTPELKVQISPRIRELYFNGKNYYNMQGRTLTAIPEDANLRPDPDRLSWHMQNCFQA